MNKYFVFVFLYGLVFISGCTETEVGTGNEITISEFVTDGARKTPEQMPDASVENISSAHGYYTFLEFWKQVPEASNFVITPADWQLFLAYLAPGASNASLIALSDAALINLEASLEDISVWEQQLNSLSVINRQASLQAQTNYLFSQNFLNTHIELFGTILSETDFGNYPTSFASITYDTRLLFSQSSEINAGWSDALTAEETVIRFGDSSEQQWVNATKLSGVVKSYQGESFEVLQLPLTNDELSLVLLIPDEGVFDSVAKSLDYDTWNTIIAGLQPENTFVYLPDFSMHELIGTDELPSVGAAMSAALADFSAINGQGYLYIDEFRQQIDLTVSKLGIDSNITSTAIFNATEDEPSSVFAGITITNEDSFSGLVISTPDYINYKDCFYTPEQSPFIFAIYHQVSKTILHLGQVKSLQGQLIAADWQVPDTTECGTEPPVEIYKYSGSVQCDVGSGTNLYTMNLELTNAGIEVLEAREDYDGFIYPAVCGASDGKVNIFSIRQKQLQMAIDLGFNLLSDL